MPMLSFHRRLLLVAALAAWCNRAVLAQVLPARLRLIVAEAAGGPSDAVARALARELSRQLGSRVMVENRGGGRGTVGLNAVAKAAPDGMTLGFAAVDPLVLAPLLSKPPFDPMKDIVPVAGVMYSPVLLLATRATGTRNFDTLIDDARARPGAIRWATSGHVSVGRIVLEVLCETAEVDITHVPYRGLLQQTGDAVSGQFEILSTAPSAAIAAHIRAGRLRPLALGAPERFPSLPTVPTLAELGYPEANLAAQFGVFAPAGTPEILVAKYNSEINRALESPDVLARLESIDSVPTGGSATAFADEIATEYEHNARIVKAAGIRDE